MLKWLINTFFIKLFKVKSISFNYSHYSFSFDRKDKLANFFLNSIIIKQNVNIIKNIFKNEANFHVGLSVNFCQEFYTQDTSSLKLHLINFKIVEFWI
jgi:hypothetical protein